MDQTEEALGYAAEGKKFAEEYTPPDVSVKDVGKFVAEMTPIVGDAMAAKEVYDELQKDEPNYYLAGALGGAALVGLFPGIGDVAAKAIRKGAREVFDVAKRVDVDMNAMGSGLGNVKLKPKDKQTLPPAENSAKTQIAGTLPTYKKADTLLTELSGKGKTLDFGAGLGLSKKELGFDTYEPFPKGDFSPDFVSPADIPDNTYKKVTNLNVLNVVPRSTRDDIVKDIGRILKPDGRAVITTRGRDVLSAKGKIGPEPMSIITSSDTYQKGFTQPELRSYITDTLGEGFEITNNKLGAAGVTVHKLNTKNFNEGGMTMINASDQTVKAFALGGEVEEFDPVSGNEVPPGSLPEEVRDDIPAQLSEGEYIVPADVVRFHGVKKFEELRSEAKMGFNTMENTGRIGGEPIGVAVMSDELPFDVSELNMEDDGEPEAPMMNKGGYMTRGYNPGGMVNPVLQSSGGVEYKDYTNAEGKTLLIPFFNGVPMSVIPEGYFLVGTQATNAESEAAASAAAKAESDRKREGDRQDERRAPGGDLYDPTPVIKMEELTGKELEKMVADQGSMTADMINVGIGVINPIMGLFMKLGLTNSARQVKNELERRTMQSGNQQEQEYYANLLEIATQDEPGFVETVMGGIADTFSSVFQPQAKAEKIKSDYTPEEVAPESKYTGYTVAPPPEIITTELPDTPGARDDPYRNNPLVASSRFDGDEEQYRSYGAGSRTTDTTTPESTSTITDASNSGPTITKTSNKGDKADKNAAMRKAAKTAAANTKKVVTQAKKDLATPQEIEVIQKEGDRITKNLEDASRGMGLRLNKGGLMKKKKK